MPNNRLQPFNSTVLPVLSPPKADESLTSSLFKMAFAEEEI